MNWLTRYFKALPRAARLEERQDVAVVAPMARPSWQLTPSFYNPWFKIPQHQNLYLYEQLVEMVPIINAALTRISWLVGCPKVVSKTKNTAAADECNEWWHMKLRVNRTQVGGGNWFSGHVIDHLTYGRAHAEIIPSATYRDIYALQELHTRTIELRPRANRYGVEYVQSVGFGEERPLNPELLLTAVHDVRNDSPQGNSLLFGLQFMAEILNKIMASQKEVFERFGVPAYVVRYIPPENVSDTDGSKGRAVLQQAMTGLQAVQASRANGQSRDFGVVGEGSIEILGANGENLDITVPVRTIQEDIIAKTGLPSWMLGKHWSTTERMSTEEAKMISTMIDEIRGHLVAELTYLFNLRSALVGRPFEFELEWDAPSLTDEQATAQAEKTAAEALAATIKANRELWTLGAITEIEFVRRCRPDMADKTEAEIRQMLPALVAVPPQPMLPAFGQGGREESGGREGEPPADAVRPFGGRSLTYGGRNGH